MSDLTGKAFTAEDAPKSIQQDPEKLSDWIAEQTARYEVVARDESAPDGKQDIIAEELQIRIIHKLPLKARRVAPMLLRMTPEDRLALFAAFDGQGQLVNPFTPAVKG